MQQHFCWPAERKDLSSVQKGKLLVVCEELSPIKTCLRHLHHMSLVCRGHHNSRDPLRAELLLPVRGHCLLMLLVTEADPSLNAAPGFTGTALLSITGCDSWGQQRGKSFAELEKVQHTGSLTQCSQRHWMKQISARLPGSGAFLKPGHAPKECTPTLFTGEMVKKKSKLDLDKC